MLKSLLKILFFINLLYSAFGALPLDHNNAQSFDECPSNSLLDTQTLLCRGKRALRNVLYNLNKSDRPIVIVRGLEIVPAKGIVPPDDNKLSMDASLTDDSMFERFSNYLRTHELNIKFSDLLAEESERYLTRDMEQNDVQLAGVEARKKDKGHGMLLAMALMFGKLLAVLGLGGIGAIAMKALGVSLAALMLAALLGLKALAQHGGHETSSVQYVTADGGHHHKRRRRRGIAEDIDMAEYSYDKLPLPYRAWQQTTI